MTQSLPERNATSPAGLENVTSSPLSTGPQREHEEPRRLLRRATGLLSNGDLKSASETLKEAAQAMAPRGGSDEVDGGLDNDERRRTQT